MTNLITSPALSESYLVGSATAGDRSAFAALYEMHYQPLVSKVTHAFLGGNPERAADIAQQGFLDVFRNMRHIDRTQSFADSLIEAVSERVLYNCDQHDQLERADAFEELNEEFLRTDETDAACVEIQAEEFQVVAQRVAALEALATMNKANGGKYSAGLSYLFAMCEEGLSFEEIARREDKTPQQIQRAIKNAGKALRPVLASLLP